MTTGGVAKIDKGEKIVIEFVVIVVVLGWFIRETGQWIDEVWRNVYGE